MNTGLVETQNHSRHGARGAAGGLCLETLKPLCKQGLCPPGLSMTWVHVSGCDIFAPSPLRGSWGVCHWAAKYLALHRGTLLGDAFTPAQPDSHPFCPQGKSRPPGCTVTFPTPPDVPPSRAAQGTSPGGKEAETAPPQVQGCPGDSRHDSGMSSPPAQVTLAGGKARPDWLHAAEGWCVAAQSPLTQVMLGSWMIYDEVPAACFAPEMKKMRTSGDDSG